MEFNEFREKVKEALPDFLTDDLKNAEIKDTAVNKLQGESYSGISVTPEGSRVGVSINLEDSFLDYQTGSQFTAVMNRLADTLVGTLGEREQFDLQCSERYAYGRSGWKRSECRNASVCTASGNGRPRRSLPD